MIKNLNFSCNQKTSNLELFNVVGLVNSTINTQDLRIYDTEYLPELKNSSVTSSKITISIKDLNYDPKKLKDEGYLEKLIFWNPKGWNVDTFLVEYERIPLTSRSELVKCDYTMHFNCVNGHLIPMYPKNDLRHELS